MRLWSVLEYLGQGMNRAEFGGYEGRVWRKQKLGPQLAGVLNAKGRVLLETVHTLGQGASHRGSRGELIFWA